MLAQTDPFIRWDWIVDHLDEMWQRTIEHSVLTFLAIGIGLVLAIGFSMLAIPPMHP